MTISDKAYAITLLKNSANKWSAYATAKDEIEEYGLRPIARDHLSEDNGTSEGGRRRQ